MTANAVDDAQRWKARRVQAGLIRSALFLLPIAGSMAFVYVLSRIIPPPSGGLALLVVWWIVISAAATLVLALIDSLTRRLLPIVALYKLSLIFPDHAPDRFRIAIKTGQVGSLESQLADARAARETDTPQQAAERLLALAARLDAHDDHTRGHSERVRAYTRMIAEEMKLPDADLDKLNWAALLHDVGKLEIPTDLLEKPGRPTDEEFALLRKHTELGMDIAAPLFSWLGPWTYAIRDHHEHWDGRGYPAGTAGEDTSIAGRIVAVADVYDVITSTRSYKEAADPVAGRKEIAACAGAQFDPAVVRAFLAVSLGRLRLVMGPLSWLAQVPVLSRFPATPAVSTVANAAAAVLAATGLGLVAPAEAPAPEPPAVVAERVAPAAPQTPVDPPTPAEDLGASRTINEDNVLVMSPRELYFGSDSRSIRVATPPGAGTARVTGGRTLTYQPPANFWGPTSLAYDACVAGGECTTGRLDITVLPVNDAPAAADDAATVAVGATAFIDVLANDSDVDGDTLRVDAVGEPSAGTATTNGGGILWTPPADFVGVATVGYSVSDGNGADAAAELRISVSDANAPPQFTAGPDQATPEDSGAQSVAGWATGIGPGAIGEADQAVRFAVDTDNPGLFADPPAVAPDGTLTYRPAADANGTATVRVRAVDDGAGVAESAASDEQAFTIAVTAVNDPPRFTPGADRTVREDAGAQTTAGWATGLSAGPPDEAGQRVAFTAVNDNPGLFAAEPALDATGRLTFVPANDASGSASVTVVARDDGGRDDGGRDTGPGRTFTITVLPVNDRPTFTLGADQSVDEDAGPQSVADWVTGVSPGPASEADQIVDISVSADNPGLFAVQPAVDAAGTLTYTPAVDAYGSVELTVRARDDGGTDDGGQDTTGPQTATLTLTPVNDAPSFLAGADQSVVEDAGPQSVAGWATSISAGAVESGQSVSFSVASDNPGLFAVPPAISADGTLTFTPAPDANGLSTLDISVRDDGGTSSGGSDASATQSVSITVRPVNDAPTFGLGADPTVPEDSGAQTIVGWVSAISPGPTGEGSQMVSLSVANDNAALFATPPAVAANGTLTYTPAPDANGVATVSVGATDTGGTADGGQNTSPVQNGTITVTAVNDDPVALGDSVNLAEDQPGGATFNVLANDSDVDLDPLSVSSTDTSGIVTGSLVDNGGGSFTYTPGADANGLETFAYDLSDGNGGSDTATVMITTTPQPDSPAAVDDSYVVVTGMTLNVAAPGVLSNDTDADGDPLTVETTPVSGPSNGALTLRANGSFDYTPAGGYTGSDSFTYRVGDGTGRTDEAVVSINVTGPTATSLFLQPSGSSADDWDLATTPAPDVTPVPDHDGDGDPGLRIKASDGDEGNTDPLEFQTWNYLLPGPVDLAGPVTFKFWSTIAYFDDDEAGHPDLYFYDCDALGNDCNLLASDDFHVNDWNGGTADFVYREFTIGSVNTTVAGGRTLRVRLLHRHDDLWVAMTQNRASELEITTN